MNLEKPLPLFSDLRTDLVWRKVDGSQESAYAASGRISGHCLVAVAETEPEAIAELFRMRRNLVKASEKTPRWK